MLAANRAYFHPYRWTSLGLSLIEAMTIGMPVLALPVTAAPESVPAAAGVLSSDPAVLAATARRWLADPDEASERGCAGAPACPRTVWPATIPHRLAALVEGGGRMRIAMVSEHASPLAALGGVDAGRAERACRRAVARPGRARTSGSGLHPAGQPDPAGARAARPRRRRGPCAGRARRPLPKDELLPFMPEFGRWLADAWISDGAPDLVHGHFWMSGLAALEAARHRMCRWCRPSTPWARSSDGIRARATPARAQRHSRRSRHRPARRPGHRHLLPTRSSNCTRMGVPRRKIRVVPCGVDTGLFTPIAPPDELNAEPSSAPTLLSIGRLVNARACRPSSRRWSGCQECDC